MASARAAITVSWGEASLADIVVAIPCTWGDALRETSVFSARQARIESTVDGAIEVRAPDGRVLVRATRDEPGTWSDDGLTIRIAVAAGNTETPLPPPPSDRTFRAVLAMATCAVVSLCVWFEARPSTDVSDRQRLAALSHLVARTTASRPSAEHHTPPTPPSDELASPEAGPSDPLADPRLERVDSVGALGRGPVDPSNAMRAVANRGVLGLTTMTPQLARALRNTVAAIASMQGAPIAGMAPVDDRVHYGSMTAGIGAGAGCPPGVDCGTVAVRLDLGDRWRPRAASLAHAAMQARTTVAPTVRAAPPEMGELTMAYVQQRIRRDLLADVQRCYNDRLEQTPDLPSGRVVVRFEVATDGSVHEAAIVTTAIAQSEIEACITHVLRDARFPTNETGARVTYPFVFSSLMPDR